MPAFRDNIAKNRLCDLQVMPGARIAWLGEKHYEIGGGHKKFNTSNPRVWTKKKVFISKNARIFTNSGVKPRKKDSLLQNLQKTVLVHEFWGKNQYLGSLRPWAALQWHRACYFLLGTILAWGAQFLFGGTSSDLGDTALECPPWRWACCKITEIYRTVPIVFSLKRYCSKSVLLKKWELFEVTKRLCQ